MSQIQTDAKSDTGVTVIAWILAVLTLGYMLPWAVAETRGKSNSAAIALVNFLAGWTVVGWIIALVMACGPHQIVAVAAPVSLAPVTPKTWIDPATGRTCAHNPATGEPMFIDPVTGLQLVEAAPAVEPPTA